MRFIRLAGLLAFIAVTCYLVQIPLAIYASPDWSLEAHYGPGQTLLYVIVLASISLFLWLNKREEASAKTPPPRSPLARPLKAYLLQKDRVRRGFLAGLLPTLACTTICYTFLICIGAITWKDNLLHRITPTVILQTSFSLLVVVVLTTTEELIFRAFLFNYLYTNKKRAVMIAAVVTSSFIFAFIHKFRDFHLWLQPENWNLFITLFFLGTLLCLTYRAGQSLACSVGVHTGILLPEVFRNQSHLMDLHQDHWWMGTNSDIRTAPVTWGLLAALYGILWLNHKRLNAISRIRTLEELEAEGGAGHPVEAGASVEPVEMVREKSGRTSVATESL